MKNMSFILQKKLSALLGQPNTNIKSILDYKSHILIWHWDKIGILQIEFNLLFSLDILHKVKDIITSFAYIYYGLIFWKVFLKLNNGEFF